MIEIMSQRLHEWNETVGDYLPEIQENISWISNEFHCRITKLQT